MLEEWITNVLSYGLTHTAHPWLAVEISPQRDQARITIADNGVAFDPTKHPAPNLSVPAEERPIGGLGIFMIRKLCSATRYHREGEQNVFTLDKSLLLPVLTRAEEGK